MHDPERRPAYFGRLPSSRLSWTTSHLPFITFGMVKTSAQGLESNRFRNLQSVCAGRHREPS